MKTEIEKLKQEHQDEMNNYDSQTRQFLDEYGYKECDYLSHRRNMSNYHRGAVNVLIELERRFK